MAHLFSSLLAVHIAFGTVALLIAPLAMATVKGGLWHRRWGKIYFWSMAGVAVTAVGMCWLRSGVFLFLIAVFSFYLAFTGYRVLGRKKPTDRAGALDWVAAGAMVVAGAGLMARGMLAEADPARRPVPIVLGAIGLVQGANDLRRFRRPSIDKRAWMYAHLTRFVGAYIATVTAFSAVNFQFLPFPIRWLWPTAAGTTGIILWQRHYRRKFARPPPRIAEAMPQNSTV